MSPPEQSKDPAAVPTIGLQQFEHPFIGGPGLLGKAPRHEVRQMHVADRNGIGNTESRPESHRGCPGADAREGLEPCGRHGNAGSTPLEDNRASGEAVG